MSVFSNAPEGIDQTLMKQFGCYLISVVNYLNGEIVRAANYRFSSHLQTSDCISVTH